MPPQIFKNKVIAAAGPLPGQLTVENLKRWTENRRGTFAPAFDETVTHLLCTRSQFCDKRNVTVRSALEKRQGRRRVLIVHYEWFEFSAAHNEKIPEKGYLIANREADRKARDREERRLQRGLEEGLKFVNTNLHHVYWDREFFNYQIELLHYDQSTSLPDGKYVLTLWESNAKPHLYWFTAKLLKSKDGKRFFRPVYHRDSDHSVKFRTALKHFTTFFEKQCKIAWEDRVSLQGTVPIAWQYAPPTGGKPVGRRLRHSYEYCLEINAFEKKALGLEEEVHGEGDSGGPEEMRSGDDDDDDAVQLLREDLMSENEDMDVDGEMEHGHECEQARCDGDLTLVEVEEVEETRTQEATDVAKVDKAKGEEEALDLASQAGDTIVQPMGTTYHRPDSTTSDDDLAG